MSQVILDCREREEDLEKRQFFLNRELRPLMQIPGQQGVRGQTEVCTCTHVFASYFSEEDRMLKHVCTTDSCRTRFCRSVF